MYKRQVVVHDIAQAHAAHGTDGVVAAVRDGLFPEQDAHVVLKTGVAAAGLEGLLEIFPGPVGLRGDVYKRQT